MKKKLLAMVAAISMMAMSFTGCGGADEKTESQNTTGNTEAGGTEQGTAGGTEQGTAGGTEQDTVSTPEQKDIVVASSVAVVQILDALGVEMVGVPTSSYELPESVKDATRIGNPMAPDMEVIASLEPTVVVSVDTLSADLKSQFDTIGAESFFVNLSSYDGLKTSINSLGEKFGVEAKAKELISSFESKETEIAKLAEGKKAPSVLIIFGASGSFMAASEDTYVGDLVKRVGGVNVIADAPSSFSPVDMEYLAGQNPEYILFMAHANPEESLAAFKQEFETNEAWQNFDAVKNDKVIALETGYFGMSANLLAPDAMQMLAEILY